MGSPQMWRDICLTNRDPILLMLDELVAKLQELRLLVAEGNGEQLYTHLTRRNNFVRISPG